MRRAECGRARAAPPAGRRGRPRGRGAGPGAGRPRAAALRAACTADHALQCGYCTPGMLVTARDIVLRLPDADDARVRLELAGNLCRCTGYVGIVRAIRRVLETRPETTHPARATLPVGPFPAMTASATPATPSLPQIPGPAERPTQGLRLNLPPQPGCRAV